ncbi:hypothetical protein, partial [Cloacibacillus evryensis]|uniref:hypothetical protein n=1 Tax=Cloacibacillus evryensis TaxID=508460 RepID=UPI00210D7DC8
DGRACRVYRKRHLRKFAAYGPHRRFHTGYFLFFGYPAGSPLAQKSQLAVCEFAGEDMTLTVNVSEQSILSAVRFRRAQVEKRLAAFFGCKKIKVDFRVGPVIRHSQAQPPLPSDKRRAPVVLSEEDVEAEKRDFEESGLSGELALRMAHVKLSLEKLSRRSSG